MFRVTKFEKRRTKETETNGWEECNSGAVTSRVTFENPYARLSIREAGAENSISEREQ